MRKNTALFLFIEYIRAIRMSHLGGKKTKLLNITQASG